MNLESALTALGKKVERAGATPIASIYHMGLTFNGETGRLTPESRVVADRELAGDRLTAQQKRELRLWIRVVRRGGFEQPPAIGCESTPGT